MCIICLLSIILVSIPKIILATIAAKHALNFPTPTIRADRWNYPFDLDSDQSSRWAAIWPIIWVDFRYAFHRGRCQDPNLSSNMATTIPRESGNDSAPATAATSIQIIPPTKATIRAIFRKLHTRPVKGPVAPGGVSHVSAVARSTLPWTDLHANFTLTWAREPQFAVNNGYSATLGELGIGKRFNCNMIRHFHTFFGGIVDGKKLSRTT